MSFTYTTEYTVIITLLNRLEQLQFISRTPSLIDKRKTLVSLTEKGKGNVLESRQEREEWLANLIGEHYSDQEKETIRQALDLLSILPEV